ncbi:MAG: hypothetical protein IT358_05705, partial [Gemmatimonadaceae bacterium]|nr:hypothetical protein [Gemmatimonadaceae bacterium]
MPFSRPATRSGIAAVALVLVACASAGGRATSPTWEAFAVRFASIPRFPVR